MHSVLRPYVQLSQPRTYSETVKIARIHEKSELTPTVQNINALEKAEEPDKGSLTNEAIMTRLKQLTEALKILEDQQTTFLENAKQQKRQSTMSFE